MSLSSLISEGYDIVNEATGIFNKPLGAKGYLTEGISYALNNVKSKNWRFDLGYSFEVEGSSDFSKFALQINPQDLQQAENFAISVTPCQTGVVVEHQGFITKQLTISGTTGIRPIDKARTGYEEFQLLRNYFRSYAEAKTIRGNNNLRLIFRNKKDNEHWYVEPVGPGVVLRRNSARPFLYDYTIILLIVGEASERPKAAGVFGDKFDDAFNTVLDNIENVETVIDNVSDKIQQVAEIIHNSADLLKRVNNQIAITLTNPVDKIATVFQSMSYAKSTFSSLPKSFYEEVKRSAENVRDNFIDLIGGGDNRYNLKYNRTKFSGSKSFVLSDVEALEGVSDLITTINYVLSSDITFSPEANSGVITGKSTNLDDALLINSSEIQSKRLSSNESLKRAFNGVLEFKTPTSVKEVTIKNDDTLERLAYREMGSKAHLWYQIALLNNLDPPYISETSISGKNTKTFGDLILIPLFEEEADTQYTLQKSESKVTENMTIFERNLGVDLELTAENDIAYDPTSQDLELIGGLSNAAQAVKVKLGLERDALLYHPEIGVDMQVGQKMVYTAEEITHMIEQTILADRRFISVDDISVARENDLIRLLLSVKINNFNKPVPLQMNIKE